MTRSQLLSYFVIGFGCCLGVLAVAAVAALAVVNTGGDPRAVALAATPTAQQLKEALEFMSREGVTGPASSGATSSGGGGAGAGALATATPATTPQVSLGGGSAPSAPSSTSPSDATPRATTTSGSNSTVPTRVPFTPPTIVAIQPLAPTPTR